MTDVRPNPPGRAPFTTGMGGTHSLRLVLALAALCLGACGHAAPPAGERLPDGLLRAPEPVQLPILADLPAPVSGGEEGARAAITLNAQGEFLLPAGPVDDVHAPGWIRTRLDRSIDSAGRRALREALAHGAGSPILPLVADGAAPWGEVLTLLSCVDTRSQRLVRLRLAVSAGRAGAPASWLDVWVADHSTPRPEEVVVVARLVTTDGKPFTDVTILGDAWPRRHGCERDPAHHVPGWGGAALAAWARALDEAGSLVDAESGEIGATVVAESAAVRDVLPFLAAARERGIERIDLGGQTRRVFEDTVDQALRWLAAHPLADGSWDAERSPRVCQGKPLGDAAGPAPALSDAESAPGLTGRALCAFLGAGYTNRGRHPFARVVSKALRHLKNMQGPEGGFGPEAATRPLEHAWCALAMLEVYGMTGSPIFKGSAQAGLSFLGQAWRPGGGDALATLLTAQALASAALINADARRRGKSMPLDLDPALDEALRLEVRDATAAGTDRPAPATLLARLLLAPEICEEPLVVEAALACVDALAAEAGPPEPLHAWIVTTLAWRVGGEAWKRWQALLKERVGDRQERDGQPCCALGSWDPPAAGAAGGRVAATALYGMCFEFYYRYERVIGGR